MTCWSLFAKTFDINLYRVLQQKMGLKSDKWEALEDLGPKVIKGVGYLREKRTRFEKWMNSLVAIFSYSFPIPLKEECIVAVRSWCFIWVHLKHSLFDFLICDTY